MPPAVQAAVYWTDLLLPIQIVPPALQEWLQWTDQTFCTSLMKPWHLCDLMLWVIPAFKRYTDPAQNSLLAGTIFSDWKTLSPGLFRFKEREKAIQHSPVLIVNLKKLELLWKQVPALRSCEWKNPAVAYPQLHITYLRQSKGFTLKLTALLVVTFNCCGVEWGHGMPESKATPRFDLGGNLRVTQCLNIFKVCSIFFFQITKHF